MAKLKIDQKFEKELNNVWTYLIKMYPKPRILAILGEESDKEGNFYETASFRSQPKPDKKVVNICDTPGQLTKVLSGYFKSINHLFLKREWKSESYTLNCILYHSH